MAASPTSPGSTEVFYSYAHEDEPLLGELLKHLGILKRLGVIRDWHDRKITAGTEWKGQIDEHLDAAGVILLLVSPDFIDSDYCWGIELMRALERHEKGDARVIPVILRPVDNWQAAPFAKLGAAPTDGRPVTSWPNRDEAFADVAGHIRRAVEELRIPPPGLQKLITNSIGMKLVLIPAGEFLMGSERSAKGRCPANRTAYGVYLVQCYSDPGNRNVGEVNLFMLRLFDESGPVGRADSPRCMLDRIGPFSVRSKAKGL